MNNKKPISLTILSALMLINLITVTSNAIAQTPLDHNQNWEVSDFELLDFIDYWAAGSYCWDESTAKYKAGCVDGEYKTVFLSSETYGGNLGGVVGADEKCQELANAASLPGTYKAWISAGPSDNPSTNFLKSNVPYKLVDRTVVATDWADLTDGTLNHAIDITEKRVRIQGGQEVIWSNTKPDATSGQASCQYWTTDYYFNYVGFLGILASNSEWTYARYEGCDWPGHLYCFEQ